MLLRELEVGLSIEIEVIRNKNINKFNSYIEERTEEGGVVVLAPMKGLKIFDFKETDLVYLIYNSSEGLKKWKCKYKVIKSNDVTELLSLSCNTESIGYNRRCSYRMTMLEDVVYKCKGEVYSGILSNISYSGIGLRTNNKHDAEDTIELTILLNGITIQATGKIARIEEDEIAANKYKYGIQLESKTEQAIAKYINERQRLILSSRNKRRV